MADLLEFFERVAGGFKPDAPLAISTARGDFAFQAAAEVNPFAGAHLSSRPHQRFPFFSVRAHRTQQENLDAATQMLSQLGIILPHGQRVHARAVAEQSRRKDARVVEHQAIARMEKLRQLAKEPIFPAVLVAVHHQHARRRAVCQRLLRDQLLRQVIVESRQIHSAFTVTREGRTDHRLSWSVRLRLGTKH